MPPQALLGLTVMDNTLILPHRGHSLFVDQTRTMKNQVEGLGQTQEPGDWGGAGTMTSGDDNIFSPISQNNPRQVRLVRAELPKSADIYGVGTLARTLSWAHRMTCVFSSLVFPTL